MAESSIDALQHLIAVYDDGEGPALETRVLSSRWGTPSARVALPYTAEQADVVLKLIERPTFMAPEFQRELPALRGLGWVQGTQLSLPRPRLLEQVGARLYDTLFPRGAVRTVLNIGLSQARQARQALLLQLHLDREAGHLARLPWELLYDGQEYLVRSGRLALARYIAFRAPATPLALQGPLRVLVVVARPRDLPGLDESAELLALKGSLAILAEEQGLELQVLEPPTWRAFVDAMSGTPYHIVHFDGHGDFGRRCPACRRLVPAGDLACQARIGPGRACGAPLEQVSPQGHLAFERSDGTADWRSAENLAAALFRNQALRLAVLSACRSAAVGQGPVFAGTAPALIGMGVPAVAAMQFEVPLYTTVSFAEAFYGALAERAPLSEAMARARAQFDDESWYRPALYLRSMGDPRGVLFAK
ncbi:MAG TPA: CHAT domain-containing protein [Anaerolineae bacterium]|nr:CHAT domain-containing protein [Anaerolineae bacterium]HOR00242.1 CHAT domain-containing protein [Anaerolineae bacterium]HPL27760.1 CHAT domain-containing protein [Anaerolineae bacterium]